MEGNRESQALDEFRELYKSMAPLLIFYAGKFVDPTTAEDLVQDVFLRIWQKRVLLLLKDDLKGYLYRSVRHACLDYLKHYEVESNYMESMVFRLKIEEIQSEDDSYSIFEEDERLLRIYKALAILPLKCREIFVMSYLEDRKSSEIAALLNLSKRTVEAQLYKALKMLRATVLPALIPLILFFF